MKAKLTELAGSLNEISNATYDADLKESSKHSVDIVARTMALVKEILASDSISYFKKTDNVLKISQLFIDFDNRVGTLVPAVYNRQSHALAKAILQFLNSIDTYNDFGMQMNLAFKIVGDPTKEINRLRKRLNDKIKQFEFMINPSAKFIRDDIVIAYSQAIEKIQDLITKKADFSEVQAWYVATVNDCLAQVLASDLPHYQITQNDLFAGFREVTDDQSVKVLPLYHEEPPIFDKDYFSCDCVMDTPFVHMFNVEEKLNMLLHVNGYEKGEVLDTVRKTVSRENNPELVKQVQNAIAELVATIKTEMKSYLDTNPHAIKANLANVLLSRLTDNVELKIISAKSSVHRELLIDEFKNTYAGKKVFATLVVGSLLEDGNKSFTVAGYNYSGKSFKQVVIDDKTDRSGKLRMVLAQDEPSQCDVIRLTYSLLGQQPPNDFYNIPYADACFVQCGFLYRELQSILINHHHQVTAHNQNAGLGKAISLGRLNDSIDNYLDRLLTIVGSINLSNSPGMAHQLCLHQEYAQEKAERAAVETGSGLTC